MRCSGSACASMRPLCCAQDQGRHAAYSVPPSRQFRAATSASAAPPADASEVRELLLSSLLNAAEFSEMTLKGRLGPNMPWRSCTVRPVKISNSRQLQFSCLGGRQNIVKNYEADVAQKELAQLLNLTWSSVQLRSSSDVRARAKPSPPPPSALGS
jgi:hypothetical protein